MQEKYPQKPGIDFILKQAFYYWNRTLLYQVLFSIIYAAIFLTAYFFFSEKYQVGNQLMAAMSELMNSGGKDVQKFQSDLMTISSQEGYAYFQLAMLGVSAFLYPMNLGFYQIYRKIDLKQQVEFSDLFVGYNGLNFFRYTSYFVFWYLASDMLKITIFLPFVWVLITLFIAPLMFFQNKTIFEGIALNWKVLKLYFIEIFVCTIVAVLFKYVGFMLFLVGALFTFPFWNAMIYSLYKTIFVEEKTKEVKIP